MYKSKISPEEALELIKVRMNYDTKKTLKENKRPVSEQSLTQTAGGVAGGLLARGAGATAAASLATTLGATGSAVPIVGTAAGIIIGYGLGTLIDWAANHDYGESGFRKVMQACSSKGISKLVPQLSKADVRQIAYSIEDAKGQWNDDEDRIAAELAKIPTIADLCAVDKKIQGGLANFLDDLTDSPDEWKMFTRPLEGMIEDTEIVLTPEEQKKAGQDQGQEKTKDGAKKVPGKNVIKTPSELATVEGIKGFQDWLDTNHPGWATGYKDGIVNKGKNGGGYGSFGPRTSKAWASYKNDYLSGKTNKQDDEEVSVAGEGGVNEPID